MIPLKKYLEIVGLVSGKELMAIYKNVEHVEELEKLVKGLEVSVHTEGYGGKNYRYPFYEPKTKGGPAPMMELIKNRPFLNAKTIREILKISQASFERMEAELMGSGQLQRTKKGVAWLYSATGVEETAEPEVAEETPESTREARFSVFVTHWFAFHGEPGERAEKLEAISSVQALAENCEISRDSTKKALEWLKAEGILVKGSLQGFWDMNLEDRKKWFKALQITPIERALIKYTTKPQDGPQPSNLYARSSTIEDEPEDPTPRPPIPPVEDLVTQFLTEAGEDGLSFKVLRKKIIKARGRSLSEEELGKTLKDLEATFFDGGDFDESDPTTAWVSLVV